MARAVRKLKLRFPKPKRASNSIKDGFRYNMPKSQNVAVTGASGFIGTYLCDYLMSAGFNPVAISGNKRILSKIMKVFVVKTVKGEKDWGSIFESNDLPKIDCLVHLMGRSQEPDISREELVKANALETKNLLEYMKKIKLRRFIYVSTVRVSGEETSKKPINERVIRNPKDNYAYSKYRTEIEIEKFCKENDIEFVILRAPIIYGPKVFGNFLELMKVVYRGYPLPFGMIGSKRSVLYLGNLADAITKVVDSPEAKNQVFVLKDSEDLKFSKFVRLLKKELDSPNIIFPVPVFILKLLGKVSKYSKKIEKLSASLQVDDSKIKKTIGWEPPFSVFYGISDTANWFKKYIVKQKL